MEPFQMLLKKYFLSLVFLFAIFILSSQGFDNEKNRVLVITKDKEQQIDSLSVIPGSVILYDQNDKPLFVDFFEIDELKSVIRLSDDAPADSMEVKLSYSTFNFNIFQPINRKDPSTIHGDLSNPQAVFRITREDRQNVWDFRDSDLHRSGSISRGISMGNAQNVIVNSDMNLQLEGKLGSGFNILAAITDRNIPLQPDGNTQQLQDFDKVFIKIYNEKTSITAGDFSIKNNRDALLKFNKNLLGLFVEHSTSFKDSSSLKVSSALSVAKGKYRRQSITPVEGNQGPYRLVGESGESNIVIIAGSEKVYVDGLLQERGEMGDYIIDYNIGEIVFTARQVLTKDRRVVVEFEYSDKHYSRSLAFNEVEFENKKSKSYISFFHEGDVKSQSIQPILSAQQKQFLRGIGDDVNSAWYPSFDSLLYNPDEVRYMMVDTLVQGQNYDSIFVYSINPDNAIYRVSFTYVGKNRGNYVQDISSANGRVFKWVAPLDNVPQGDFSPEILLVPPQKKQMLQVGNETKIGKHTNINSELALSLFDKNTFAKDNKDDVFGTAARFGITDDRAFIKSDTAESWRISTNLNYEFLSRSFEPIDPLRDLEFQRNFGIMSDSLIGNQHFSSLGVNVYKKSNFIKSNIYQLSKAKDFKAWQYALNSNLNLGRWTVLTDGFMLFSDNESEENKFLKNHASLSYDFGKIALGTNWRVENQQIRDSQTDSLKENSFAFSEIEFMIKQGSNFNGNFMLYANFRNDEKVHLNSLEHYSNMQEYGLKISNLSNKNHSISTNILYRERNYSNNFEKSEYVFGSNLDYSASLFDKALRHNTFYEAASGQEPKKEYYFLKVAKGTGDYVWFDYNENGVQELDEFEQAFYSDQGEYVKLWRITNDFISTYNSKYSQSLQVSAPQSWKKKSGFKKFISRFSNQTNYRIEKKLQSNPLSAYNPFVADLPDSLLVTSLQSLRNVFSINQGSPLWSNEFIYNENKSKVFLTNGFENREFNSFSNVFRLNVFKKHSLRNELGISEKAYGSEQFENRNYNIVGNYIEQSFISLLSSNFRFTILYKYSEKQNTLSVEREQLFANLLSAEATLNVVSKAMINFKTSYVKNVISNSSNQSLVFEMLEGLNEGHNFILNLAIQSAIGENMQLSFSYEGRKSLTSRFIHIGNVSVRAYF